MSNALKEQPVSENRQLYKIMDEMVPIFAELEASDGEITDEIRTQLEKLEIELPKKIDNIAEYLKNIGDRIEIYKRRKAEFDAAKKRLENLYSKLENYIILQLLRAGLWKVDCPLNAVQIRENPPAVEITDEKEIPAEYWKIKQVTQLDKVSVKEKLKAGETIPGVTLGRKKKIKIN